MAIAVILNPGLRLDSGRQGSHRIRLDFGDPGQFLSVKRAVAAAESADVIAGVERLALGVGARVG